MLQKIFALAFIVSASAPQSHTMYPDTTEYWGFCTATKDQTIYISTSIAYPIEDAQLNYPNTKVIRKWRLSLKSELGDEYNDTWKLNMEHRYCSGTSYYSKLDTDEGRDCFIKRAKKEGKTIKEISFFF